MYVYGYACLSCYFKRIHFLNKQNNNNGTLALSAKNTSFFNLNEIQLNSYRTYSYSVIVVVESVVVVALVEVIAILKAVAVVEVIKKNYYKF